MRSYEECDLNGYWQLDSACDLLYQHYHIDSCLYGVYIT